MGAVRILTAAAMQRPLHRKTYHHISSTTLYIPLSIKHSYLLVVEFEIFPYNQTKRILHFAGYTAAIDRSACSMVRLHVLSWIISTLVCSVATQTPTPVFNSATPTATDNVTCETPFIKNYGYQTYCTPIPTAGDHADDAPAIQSAIKRAASYNGRVFIPENQTFTIRSPILVSNIQYFGLIINGVLKVAGTESDWKDADAIIAHEGVYEYFLEGDSGIIDASDLRFDPGTANPPALLDFKNSSEVFLQHLALTNAPGTYLRIDGGQRYDTRHISMVTEKGYGRPDAYGVQLSDSQNVFFDDFRIQFEDDQRRGNCFAIDATPPPGWVYLSNIVCDNTHTGVTVMLGSSGTKDTNETISVTGVSTTNLTVNANVATGFLNPGFPRVNVSDVTFDNVTVQDGDAVVFSNCWQLPGQTTEQSCKATSSEGRISQNYTDIWLENYQGKLSMPPHNQTGDVLIDVHIVNWGQES
jgi:hypothetical protein